jgi:hypothetical protein
MGTAASVQAKDGASVDKAGRSARVSRANDGKSDSSMGRGGSGGGKFKMDGATNKDAEGMVAAGLEALHEVENELSKLEEDKVRAKRLRSRQSLDELGSATLACAVS